MRLPGLNVTAEAVTYKHSSQLGGRIERRAERIARSAYALVCRARLQPYLLLPLQIGFSRWRLGSARLADGHSVLAEEALQRAETLNAVMKNRGCERGVRAAFAEHFEKCFGAVRAA